MPEPSFLELFRSRWQEIARQFWPETPRQQLQSELARLDAELGRRQSRLLILRKRIEKLHYSQERCERRLARLAALVQKAPADADMGAELQRQQQCMDRLRERIKKHERGYLLRLARLGLRKQKRAELRERLLWGSLPEPRKEENDPDYPF